MIRTLSLAAAALLAASACAGPNRERAADTAATAQPSATAERAPAGTPTVVVYKSPSCGCCAEWVDRMRDVGFTLEVHDVDDVSPQKEQLGVPLHLGSCHTASVDGYALEGHVPPEVVLRLLRERPAVAGIAVPGMPAGSPGMEMGDRRDPYDIVAWSQDGTTQVYESRR